MNSVLVEQIQLIFDSINTNIALGIEYKNLDQSIKKYMTDHKSPLLLENINKTCIDEPLEYARLYLDGNV